MEKLKFRNLAFMAFCFQITLKPKCAIFFIKSQNLLFIPKKITIIIQEGAQGLFLRPKTFFFMPKA